jgi:hypothetical protein
MVRRIANLLLAAMPVIFVAGVSSNAGVEPPRVDEAKFGPQDHARILAYVEPVRLAGRALGEPDPALRRAAVREAAGHWVALWEARQLDEVRNPSFEAAYVDTVLAGIGRAKVAMMTELEAPDPGSDADMAARDLVLAVRLAQVSKYADLAETHQVSFRQARIVRGLERLLPRLSRPVVTEVVATLERFVAERPRIDECVMALRTAHTKMLAVKGRQKSALKLARSYLELARATQEPTLVARALTKRIARALPPEAAEGMAGVVTAARLAKSSDDEARKSAESLLASLRAVSIAHQDHSRF